MSEKPQDTEHSVYVEVSRELLAILRDGWSPPVQVMCQPGHRANVVEMTFRTVPSVTNPPPL